MKINLQNSKQFQAAKTYTLKHNNKDLKRSLELAEKYKTDVAVGVFIKKYLWARKKIKQIQPWQVDNLIIFLINTTTI